MTYEQRIADAKRRGASLIEHERMLRTQRDAAERARLATGARCGYERWDPEHKRVVHCQNAAKHDSCCGRLCDECITAHDLYKRMVESRVGRRGARLPGAADMSPARELSQREIHYLLASVTSERRDYSKRKHCARLGVVAGLIAGIPAGHYLGSGFVGISLVFLSGYGAWLVQKEKG